jgi:hypothetical protein
VGKTYEPIRSRMNGRGGCHEDKRTGSLSGPDSSSMEFVRCAG